MNPNITLISDGKKFMWDGLLYETQEEASRAGQVYQDEKFQTRMIQERGKFLVYTRRTVQEIVVPAQ